MNVPTALDQRSAFEPAPRLGWTVVATKLRAARNRAAVTRRRSPILTGIQLTVVVPGTIGFAALLTVGFASAFSSMTDPDLATTLLAALLAMGGIGAFIGGSTSALQALYLSDDIPFLLALPIPLRVLFGSKFVEAAVGAAPPAVLMLSAVAGFGLAEPSGGSFWLLAPLLIVSSVVISTSIAVVVVSVVTRYIPPKRARLFLFAISMSVIAATIFGWRLLAPRPDVLTDVVERSDYEPLWRAVAWTPAGWGAQGLRQAGNGALGAALTLAALHMAVAVALSGFASAVFQRTFVRGLDRTTAVQRAAPSESTTARLTAVADLLPQRIGALVLREWLMLVRDLKRLSGAIWPLGMVLVYTILLGRSGSSFESDRLTFWSKNGSLALLPWGLSLGISVYTYGAEGRSFNLLRSLPASPATIFVSKVVASLLPVAVVGLGTATTSLWFRQTPLVPSLQLLTLVAWMTAGYVVIDTSAAALAPNFEAPNIQRAITLTGRMYGFALGGTFGLATLAAAGRLILYGAVEPESWRRVVDAEVGGIRPLGWPLIVVAAAVAIASIALAAMLAIRQTNRLLELPT